MRLVAQKAGVSNTAFYRHFKNKNDLKAELMRRGFEMLYEGVRDIVIEDNFSSYGAHYIRFGLDYPHIYDLMFENTHIDVSLYPRLEPQSNASFNGLVKEVGPGSGSRNWDIDRWQNQRDQFQVTSRIT